MLHNKVPIAVVDKTELPQLFITVTTGVEGIGLTFPLFQLASAIPPIASVKELALELKVVKYTGTSQLPAPPLKVKLRFKNTPSTKALE